MGIHLQISRLLLVLLAAAGLAFVAASPAPASVRYVTQWGSLGGADGQFGGPLAIASGPGGNVFVSDLFTGTSPVPRVQRFSADGTFEKSWGRNGILPGQFTSPGAIAVSASGAVYVGDFSLNRIQRFDVDGNLTGGWGTGGSGNGQFASPWGIATDPQGLVYVVDYGNNRIQKFSPSGEYLDQWGSFGSGDGQFLAPTFIATDSSGHVFVADSGNSRVQKFTSGGRYLEQWATPGLGDGAPDFPLGIATDPNGDVLVVGTNSVQKYRGNGALLTSWGEFGKGDGQFRNPQGIATDGSGNIYVGDSGNSRVQKFHDSGPPYPAPGRSRIVLPRPRPITVAGGRSGRLVITVRNTGPTRLQDVRVCGRLSGRAQRLLRPVNCVRLGSVVTGGRKLARLRISARCRGRGNVPLQVRATAANAKSVKTTARVRVTACRNRPAVTPARPAPPEPKPPHIPPNFDARGRYLVPDLGIDVPFSYQGENGNLKMTAGGRNQPIWFMNIIYGKPGEQKKLYTVTYRWPGVTQEISCGAIGNFSRESLNAWLARSSFVGREILRGKPDRYVNHWRVTGILPALPPGNFFRLPITLGDIYVDERNPATWWQVLHFGFQNVYDPELDEWFELKTFKHRPGKVTLPNGCPE